MAEAPIRASITDLIRTTDEIVEPKRSVLYLGPPKTGKTHNALSWPDPTVLYFDQNIATLQKHPGIRYLIPDLKTLTAEVFPALHHGEFPGETIVVDSASYLAQDHIAENPLPNNPSRDQVFRFWGSQFNWLMETFDQLTELAKAGLYNVVVTCHEKDVTDEGGAIVKTTPRIDGQFKDVIASLFDTVLLTRVQTHNVVRGGKATTETEYFVRTVPDMKFQAAGDGVGGGGGRYRALPPRLSPGTYPALCEAWGMTTNDDKQGDKT